MKKTKIFVLKNFIFPDFLVIFICFEEGAGGQGRFFFSVGEEGDDIFIYSILHHSIFFHLEYLIKYTFLHLSMNLFLSFDFSFENKDNPGIIFLCKTFITFFFFIFFAFFCFAYSQVSRRVN